MPGVSPQVVQGLDMKMSWLRKSSHTCSKLELLIASEKAELWLKLKIESSVRDGEALCSRKSKSLRGSTSFALNWWHSWVWLSKS